MNISIILSTYNGGKFILEQLNSILNQSLIPDEVLISDDCSSDNTVAIIENFISNNKLYHWKVSVNKNNVGWRSNYIRLLSSVQGKYIFLCDQDDVWDKNKLEKMCSVIKNNNKILLLASDYVPFYCDKNAVKISTSIMKTMRYDETVEKCKFGENFSNVIRPGCTYCIRYKLLELITQYKADGSAHDAILWRIANLYDGLYIYHYSSIEFRRHGSNATPKNKKSVKSKEAEIRFSLNVLQQIQNILMKNSELIAQPNYKKNIINKIIKFYELRYKLFHEKNIVAWFILVIYYKKCYLTLKQLLGDLYIAFGKEK